MPYVPGLRSPYCRTGRLVHFGRMLDKIRLRLAGTLPEDYLGNCGDSPERPNLFDGRLCRFLRVPYADIEAHVRAHPDESAADTLAWVEAQAAAAGHPPRTDEECEIFNSFLMKRGWRDLVGFFLAKRRAEPHVAGLTIETMFDYIDYDEGRDPVAGRFWERPPES